jgi:hypothetical protein
MTRTSLILILSCVVALPVLGAGIDGKWLSEIKLERGGQEFTLKITFNLKSSGNQLTGSVITATPGGERTSEIQNGKVDGDKFSFTSMGGREGDVKLTWQGTFTGDILKGQQTREGGSGPYPFTAKRE